MGLAQLGRYTILKHLASGGMADVLLGRSEGIEGFERHVVVKRIKPELAKDRRFIEMFLDEARLAATLHHQNVVQVYDIGEDNGEYFFAMEYLHGEDLRKLLGAVAKQKQHIPLAHVVAIVSAAAAGLHYAHERRAADKKKLEIVHRDVTPSNIFIGYDGSVKLVDFGIAKATMTSSDTRTGTLKGKTSYMSPEQCKGEATIDRRSDIYSLGVVLYELATTTRLFKGESDYLIMDAIVNGKVPLPRVRRPDLPNELSSIIMRALATDRNRRFETADQMRQALDQFAVDANLSTSAMASYMKKMFGEKAEPWLDSGSIERPRMSWSDMGSSNEFAIHDQPTRAGDESYPSFASEARAAVSSPALSSSAAFPSVMTGTGESRTRTPVAWEQRAQVPAERPQDFRRHKKALLIAAPLAVALAGFGVWHRGAKPHHVTSAIAANDPVKSPPAVAPPAPRAPRLATVARAEPATPPPPIVRPDANVAPATEAKVVARPAPARMTSVAPPRPTVRSKPAVVAIEEPAAPPVVKEAKPEVSAPVPVPAPVVTPPPAPAIVAAPPASLVVESTMMVLSPATVALVARDHAGQLAKCEASNTLHGDLAITFEINGAGKVVRSQMSSLIKNVKVAACILGAVRSWQYPKPPSGSAKGVYRITYE